MTGYKSDNFAHDCQNHGCYYSQLPSWDDLIDCFPPGVYPTDVDGMVELSGNILFMEEKGCGVSLKTGQRMALRSLSRLPNVTVVIFRPRAEPDQVDVLIFDDGQPQGFQPRSREWFKSWLAEWSDNARRNPVQFGGADVGPH